MKRAFFLLTTLLFVTAYSPAQTTKVGPEETAVRAIVQTYLHGLKFNDVEDFKKAFRPDAKLMFVKGSGEFGELTQEQWYAGFAKVAGQEEKGELKITAVDISGNAASVKVEEYYADSIYIDYLSLLKLKGEWKIVNKIYTSRKK
jgi:uncharacterized protein (TIGR02246 family)